MRVILPEAYPYKSPSIGFVNRIFHPNIDESSGTVCLDVINQTWSPMFDLVNIFDVFLPQLLLYPNPKDPLNGEAASKFINDESRYKEIVKDYVKRYANEDSVDTQYKQLTKKNQQPNEETKTECATAAAVGNRRKQKELRKAAI